MRLTFNRFKESHIFAYKLYMITLLLIFALKWEKPEPERFLCLCLTHFSENMAERD